jgi:hypothetical protein
MQDENAPIYPTLPPDQQAKINAVVDLMFSQNSSHNPHPLLLLLREQQRELTARLLRGLK